MNEQNENEMDPTGSEYGTTKRKSSFGCFFYGCLFSLLLVLLLVIGGGFAGYWFLQGQVAKYTSETPADLPSVEYSEEELAEIQSRVDSFKETIEQGGTPPDLVLTAEEINALINKNEELRGKVHVAIESGLVSGEVSIPADFAPGGKGRYFNASATFNVSLDNGVLIVTLADAEVKGEKVPQQFIDAMQQQNLAQDVYKDPKMAELLRRFESLTIEDDKIILKPRVPSDGETPAAGAESAETEEAVPVDVQTAPGTENTSSPTQIGD